MRRQIAFFPVILSCLALVGSVILFSWRLMEQTYRMGQTHRINNESFEKIQPGMTEKEVEEILGGPYGQYFTGKARGRKPGFKRPVMFRNHQFDKTDFCWPASVNG